MTHRPNVLVIMTDQQKATASHLWGSTFCETPALQRLADEGVLFDCAITPHPLCCPARVSFWTSQFPHSHGGRRNETWMPPDTVHAFKLWRDAGYHIGLIGKNHCFQAADQAQFDTWCEVGHGGVSDPKIRGIDWVRPLNRVAAAHELRRTMTPQNPRFSYATSDFPLEDYGTELLVQQATRFFEQHRSDSFALWLSIPDPHEPWVCPQQYADLFPLDKIDMPPWRDEEFNDPDTVPERNRVLYEMMGVRDDNPEDVKRLMGVYYGMVRHIDDSVGRILDTLEHLQMRERTIVVFCSDHGDFMGEHAMQCKGGVFYDCLTRVPLIVSWPGQVSQGHRELSPVNLIDIVPTLFSLQGLTIPASMHGSLLPAVTDAEPREATFSEYGAGGPPFRMNDLRSLENPVGRRALIESLRWREAEGRRKMVRTRQWKYVHDPMGDLDELYDLEADPWELTNVAAVPANGEVIADMRLCLADWSIATEDSEPIPLP
ncbi:MAG: sulfatase-like hydrolase/transferase [Candidatus Latescibacterota bacterium]|nr:sulfatase-like hydrolase/transferase [Candidatus Latescibacterota bacterium]